MSLAELSALTDISVSYLNEIEKGKKYPKPNKLSSLVTALGTTYDWLISLRLDKRFGPLSKILQSNLLHELPLEVFGIEPRDLLDLISNAPTKLNAFINTLIEIARNYDMSVENFYFSVLRSYQEMHENYFEEIERTADRFRTKYLKPGVPMAEALEQYLARECGYRFGTFSLEAYPALESFRSVLKADKSGKLLLVNPRLNARQKAFVYSREAGYHIMGLEERSHTYSWVAVESFDQLLNNYKATYFAGALLIPEETLIEDVEQLLARSEWSSAYFLEMMERHQASPEMFMHRLTSILTRYFGLKKLFFLRLDHTPGTPNYRLTKELHLAGLHNPHGSALNEHYCRRWISIEVFKELEEQLRLQRYERPICRAQVSRYMESGREYFCITLARPLYPSPDLHCSITLGILVDDDFKGRCRFYEDTENVRVRIVNETCERCPASDCQERAAPPSLHLKRVHEQAMRTAIDELLREGGR